MQQLLSILFLIPTSFIFAQSNYETMKSCFVDSLLKSKVTEIIIFQNGVLGQDKSISTDSLNGKKLECISDGQFLAIWAQDGKFYAKSLSQCYESDRLILPNKNNLAQVINKLSKLNSIRSTSDKNAIIIKQDTITYSMSCDDNYNTIDHYPYKLLQIYTKNSTYTSGPIDDYIFCNPKTKDKPEVLNLKKRITTLESIIKKYNLSNIKMHKTLKNWH